MARARDIICSECSKPTSPIVALDIDGTLADYHDDFRKFCDRYYDRELEKFETEPYRGGDFADYLELSKEQYRAAKLAYRQGGGKRTMPFYEDTRDLIEMLVGYGVEIWITTTRPYNRFDSTDPDTREWLRRHDIPWSHLIYDDDKFLRLTEAVDQRRIVTVVDDLAANVNRAAELNLHPVLVSRPYNMSDTLAPGVTRSERQFLTTEVTMRMMDWWSIHA